MTLDILDCFQDNLSKQVKIAHFPGVIKMGKPENFKKEIRKILVDKYGEEFLEDTDYVIIATPKDVPFTDESKKKFSRLITTTFKLDHDLEESAVREFGIRKGDDDFDDLDEDEELPDNDMGDEDEIEEPTPKSTVLKAKYLLVKVQLKI